ncbi:MAG TPA: methyltransferase domain-containing protein [Tepidisphaeraceae bacterium]|jgi:predicted SAM-dependent methyltransferase|nr:methyltransferase domain-containing protein [Tepidisphaeraceae bacterium]
MPADAPPRLLHLGCGLIAPPEWHNVDGSWGAWFAQHRKLRRFLETLHVLPKETSNTPWPANIQVFDLRHQLPFPDNSFDACFSSHLIEHLFRNDALALLKEIHRVLKPGGACRTLVPDFRAMVEEYVGQRTLGVWYQKEQSASDDDPARRFMVRLHARVETAPRGWRQKFYSGFGDFQTHKWMYDGPSLVKLMTDAGFTDCREMALHQSAIPHIDKVEMPSRVDNGAGVIAEGTKS